MQLLSEIIRLPQGFAGMPIPWWNRAPLGFIHNTPGFAYYVNSGRRPVPDIAVSVLDPENTSRRFVVKITMDERVGTFQNVLDALHKFNWLNIALAETITHTNGELHQT